MGAMSSPATSSIASEKYVSLRTKKRNGDEVATPVWIAALADGSLGFTTDLTSGKAKRIRNFPEVTLQACNARGALKPGTTAVDATATVLSGAEAEPVQAAIKAKYGLMVSLIELGATVRRVVTRGEQSPAAAIRIELR
jgi:PPOX class probable F420-dependent enzyme